MPKLSYDNPAVIGLGLLIDWAGIGVADTSRRARPIVYRDGYTSLSDVSRYEYLMVRGVNRPAGSVRGC